MLVVVMMIFTILLAGCTTVPDVPARNRSDIVAALNSYRMVNVTQGVTTNPDLTRWQQSGQGTLGVIGTAALLTAMLGSMMLSIGLASRGHGLAKIFIPGRLARPPERLLMHGITVKCTEN